MVLPPAPASGGARPSRFSPHEVLAGRPPSMRQCGLGVILRLLNAERAPPQAAHPSSSAAIPQQVVGTGFVRLCLPHSNPAVHDPRARDPVGVLAVRPPSMRQCGLGVFVLWPNAGRAPPHAPTRARPQQHSTRVAARGSPNVLLSCFKGRRPIFFCRVPPWHLIGRSCWIRVHPHLAPPMPPRQSGSCGMEYGVRWLSTTRMTFPHQHKRGS